MIGLVKNLTWEDIKSPLLFISGMLVGVIMVAMIWYFLHARKQRLKRQDEEGDNLQDSQDEGGYTSEEGGVRQQTYPSSAIIVEDENGDYLLEDKSQLGQIIDFKKTPRRDAERQAARRELVITMLIAESFSK